MRLINYKLLLTLLLLCFSLTIASFGQETSGSIDILVKDATGAVVPNATVTIASAETSRTTAFKRVVTTNQDGVQRVLLIPPRSLYNYCRCGQRFWFTKNQQHSSCFRTCHSSQY